MCIENMTLFLILFLLLLVVFCFMVMQPYRFHQTNKTNIFQQPSFGLAKTGVFEDPYFPPLKETAGYWPRFSSVVGISSSYGTSPLYGSTVYGSSTYGSTVYGLPVNIETQPVRSHSFDQVGILTRERGGDMILPLFGRNVNHDKWQYYTLSNTGNISSKLPIKVQNRDGMNEYGINEMNNGEIVFVQGYNDSFVSTLYDSRGLSYIPYL